MYCQNCGKEIDDKAVICIGCGCAVNNTQIAKTSNKSWLVTLLLCLFGGLFGIHRFYTGHIGIGIVQLFTGGGCVIWAFIDLINILCGNFKTADGQTLYK